jgi:hypothetical protein
MALDTNILSPTGTYAGVNSNNQLLVALPTNPSQAGYTNISYNANAMSSATALTTGSGIKNSFITEDGQLYVAPQYTIFTAEFNTVSTAWSYKWNTTATTMAKAVQTNGFMRLNSGLSVTTGQGISIYTARAFTIEEGSEHRIKIHAKHQNAGVAAKQMDLGLGYYQFAGGQANPMNEFIGFRWNTSGNFQAVVETSQGTAPLSNAESLNGGVPLNDGQDRLYEIVLQPFYVEFWIDGVFYTRIAKQTGSYSVLKGVSLPIIARVFNSGTPSAAPTLDIGSVQVSKLSADNVPFATLQAGMSKSTIYAQTDLVVSPTNPHLMPSPISGTAPTAQTPTNIASALLGTAVTSMGGFYRATLTSVSATTHSNYILTAYLNPIFPTAAGVATNSRNLVITGIHISPMIVTTTLAGGGFTAICFAAVGSTAISLATAEADGTADRNTKSPRIIPLGLVLSLPATAAAGTISTDVGNHDFQFVTPLVVHPGEFIHVGFRTITVAAAVTAGVADGAVYINGYWE